ncbi:MAG TPA: hypothetical protein PKY59_07630 [Pyrinomonadaceae bacterium]|nr:hypothetical protein [Pyrinomonadaceae bacterium]
MAIEDLEFNGLITKDEFLQVVKMVGNDEEEVAKLVRWIVARRSEAEVVNLMFQGLFEFKGWDDDNPLLVPIDAVIEDFLNDQTPAPKFEGNYVQSL